jgi:hypothetical protein
VFLTPGLRKAVLAVHLACSVGWVGAVAAYLVLDLTVAISSDPTIVRGAWIAMGLIVSWAIVPLAIASLATGLLISLGTRWGLIRHWWVLISFVLTLVAVLVLLPEAGVVTRMAGRAAHATASDAAVLAISSTLPHSVGGLVVLLVVLVLNVAKPQGLTPYGWRKQQERQSAASPSRVNGTASHEEV